MAKAKGGSRNGWFTLANGLHIWGNGAGKAGKGKGNPLSKLVKNSKNSEYTATGASKKSAPKVTKKSDWTAKNKEIGAKVTKAQKQYNDMRSKLIEMQKHPDYERDYRRTEMTNNYGIKVRIQQDKYHKLQDQLDAHNAKLPKKSAPKKKGK